MSAAKIRDSQSDGDRHRDWNGATLAEPEKRNSPAANAARSRARNNPRNRRDNTQTGHCGHGTVAGGQ